MNVLLTGGLGFLGKHFVRLADSKDWEIINIDKRTYAADPAAQDSRTRNLDCSHPGLITLLGLEAGQFDVCVHLAAESHVDSSISNPSVFGVSNYMGTANMLEMARRLKIPKFIYMSTDEVTGALEPSSRRTHEQSKIVASSPYSASKAGAELLALAYATTYGMDVRVVRSTNLWGEGQIPEKMIPRAITYVLSGKPIPLYGNGKQSRDWMYVEDCVRGIFAVIERGKSGNVYCLGAECEVENRKLVEWIAAYLGGTIQHVEDRPGHDERYATNPIKAQGELEWRAGVTLNSKTVQPICDWYKENEPWWRDAIKRGCRW